MCAYALKFPPGDSSSAVKAYCNPRRKVSTDCPVWNFEKSLRVFERKGQLRRLIRWFVALFDNSVLSGMRQGVHARREPREDATFTTDQFVDPMGTKPEIWVSAGGGFSRRRNSAMERTQPPVSGANARKGQPDSVILTRMPRLTLASFGRIDLRIRIPNSDFLEIGFVCSGRGLRTGHRPSASDN